MSTKEAGKRVHASYLRAGGRNFISAFYDRLIKSSDEIREKFEHVNMDVQSDNLARAIVRSFLLVDKEHPTAERTMDMVRESHNRHNLDIQPHLYDIWLDCLIKTIAENDSESSEELLKEWHDVMSVSIEHIRGGY